MWVFTPAVLGRAPGEKNSCIRAWDWVAYPIGKTKVGAQGAFRIVFPVNPRRLIRKRFSDRGLKQVGLFRR